MGIYKELERWSLVRPEVELMVMAQGPTINCIVSIDCVA